MVLCFSLSDTFLATNRSPYRTIQGVVMATPEGTPDDQAVSRPMVKAIAAITPESFIAVEAVVKKPLEPVKSCRVSGFELHITRCFTIAAAPPMLGLTLAAANRPIADFNDEEVAPVEGEVKAAGDEKKPESELPAATMLTHLDNIAMHKRAPIQQAIAVCASAEGVK